MAQSLEFAETDPDLAGDLPKAADRITEQIVLRRYASAAEHAVAFLPEVKDRQDDLARQREAPEPAESEPGVSADSKPEVSAQSRPEALSEPGEGQDRHSKTMSGASRPSSIA